MPNLHCFQVMEVRRLSDVSLKHHSRRPSVDSSKHSRSGDVAHGAYIPHVVCKRRKTVGSDNGSRGVHHYQNSDSESVDGSRPGTPLVDERPEHFNEPRRVPREREGPLSLPLPKFAAHVLARGSVSVAGIKGQKDALASPPAVVTSPRVTQKPPSPTRAPPPASPPLRPPPSLPPSTLPPALPLSLPPSLPPPNGPASSRPSSMSSNSSDSDAASPNPSLDEQIKSLEEKYEKWSGSRALSAAGNDALAKLDANRDRFR